MSESTRLALWPPLASRRLSTMYDVDERYESEKNEREKREREKNEREQAGREQNEEAAKGNGRAKRKMVMVKREP